MVTDSGNHIGKITKSNERKTVYQRTSKAVSVKILDLEGSKCFSV